MRCEIIFRHGTRTSASKPIEDGKMSEEWFSKRYEQLGGTIAYIQVPITIRVNTLLTTQKEIISRLTKLGVELERIPFTKHGYTVKKSPFSLGAISEYLLGKYAIQEAAAQLPVEVLD